MWQAAAALRLRGRERAGGAIRRSASIVLGSLLEGQPFGLFSLRVVPKQLKLVSYGGVTVAEQPRQYSASRRPSLVRGCFRYSNYSHL